MWLLAHRRHYPNIRFKSFMMSIYEEIMMLPIKVMQVDIISYSGIIRRIENKYMPGSIRACSLKFRTFHLHKIVPV